MKQELINSALSTIQTRRRQAEAEYEARMRPLYDDPRFYALNSAYTKISIENARKEANGLKQFLKTEENLKNDLDKLKKEYGVLDLQPKYSCKKCFDKGFIDGQMCTCLKTEISKMLLAGSGFEKLETFESSIKTAGELTAIYELMQKWCHSDFKKNLVFLSGATGVGKTHLARCMANELINRGLVTKISTAYHINQDFKEFSKSFNEDLLQRYLDCDVLFIDDLGTEPLYKNVTLENFYLLINERKMRNLSTVITTNLDLADLRDRYDERIYSRVADRETSITIQLKGKDKRLKK